MQLKPQWKSHLEGNKKDRKNLGHIWKETKKIERTLVSSKVEKFGVVWKFGHINYLRNSNLFLKILLIHGYLPEFLCVKTFL